MKWINTEDGLPNHGDYVLVVQKGNDSIDRIYIVSYHEEMGFCLQPNWELGGITHWMPLPNPPIEL